MRTLLAISFWLSIYTISQPSHAEGIKLRIAADHFEAETFKSWEIKQPFSSVNKYDYPNAGRGTVDILLQLQALERGGIKIKDVEFDIYPIAHRALKATAAGKSHLMAQAYRLSALAAEKSNLNITAPVVKNGDFEKGIYTLSSNKKVLSVTTLGELKRFQPIIVSSWEKDLSTLEAISFEKILQAANLDSLVRMMSIGRADFTLLEFSSSPDLSYNFQGIHLSPIPNIKLSIIGARAYCVSKALDPNERLFHAMEKGLQLMEKEGRIKRAYEEIGFYNLKAKNWQRIY